MVTQRKTSHFNKIAMTRFFLSASILYFSISCSDNKPEQNNAPAEYTRPGYTQFETDIETPQMQLVDIAQEAGIDFVHTTGAFGKKWMPETMGSGGGFLDYNSDGLPDIFLVNGMAWRSSSSSSSRGRATQGLYENLGNGMFRDVTKAAGLDFSIYGMGCTFGDYDGDGDVDIYVTAVGANKLLRNDDGVIQEVTAAMGVTGNNPAKGAMPAWSTSATWLDYDRDGWLDLFVCNYVKWTPETDIFTTLDGKNKSYATPEQYQGETCRLYRNIGGRRFEDVTAKTGVLNENGKSLGVAVADFNDDGWPDIVVANDTQPNFLYMNNGNGTFKDIGLQAGIAYDEIGRARAGMGIDIADLANNGNL
ncbi:MAG: FG-GAP repeat domain-containing protein, partial [bacterium]